MGRISRTRIRLRPFVLAGLLASCALAVAARAGQTAAAPAVEGSAAQAGSEKGWELLERSDEPGKAYELWARIPPGSKWRDFRLIGDVDAPPAVAVEVAMDVVADPSRASAGETRRLLLRTPDVIVNYIHVDLPLVADRDVTTHLDREYDAERGEYRLVWHEANDEGPPLEPGVVRMQRARGKWVFQPLPGGRSHTVFESYADLGGSLPAWLINPLTNRSIRANLIDLRAGIARRRSAGATP